MLKPLIIYGPTASGKTAYAINIAKRINGVVINADAMQVYKELPCITAQPTVLERDGIEHLLYGYYSCYAHYNLVKWRKDAIAAIETVKSKGQIPILVGGSGLYIKSLTHGFYQDIETSREVKEYVATLSMEELENKLQLFDPVTAVKLHVNDTVRRRRALEIIMTTKKPMHEQENAPSYFAPNSYVLHIQTQERHILYERINQRFLEMLKQGIVDEVQAAMQQGEIIPKAHGVPEICAYLKGQMSYAEMVLQSQKNTRHYAKRQMTWLRHQFTNI